MSYPIPVGRIDLYRNSRWSWQMLTQTANGTPVDMTGLGDLWTSEARTSPNGPVVLTIAVDITQAADGLITLSLPAGAAADAPDQLWFDVFAADAADPTNPLAVFTGQLALSGSYTHA